MFFKKANFWKAVRNSDIESVKKYIKKGVNVDVKDKNDETALIYTMKTNNLELAKLLVEAKAIIPLKSLHTIFKGNIDEKEMVELLLIHSQVIDLDQVADDSSVFMNACERRNLILVKAMIKVGVDVNIKNSHNESPILIALHSRTVRKLLEKFNPPQNITDDRKKWLRESYDLLRQFALEKLERLAQSNRDHLLHKPNPDQIVEVLVKAGADVNNIDDLGFSAIDYAALIGDIGSIKYLHYNGGMPNLIISEIGRDLLKLVKQNNNLELLDLLSSLHPFSDEDTLLIQTETGKILHWQRSGSNCPVSYHTALAYIEYLNGMEVAGYTDWRLPTLEEATSLIEPTKRNGDLFISSKFSKNQRQIWTCESGMDTSDSWWAVYFDTGGSAAVPPSAELHVKAVRVSNKQEWIKQLFREVQREYIPK